MTNNNPTESESRPALDRMLLLAILIGAAVVIPRSLLIARAHSPSFDDRYHVSRGLMYWDGTLAGSDKRVWLNDPPLGEALVALPRLCANVLTGRHISDATFLDPPLGMEAMCQIVAAWKAILFLPLVGVVFHWCRRLYGVPSAWLALALVLVEPTIAAHIPIASLDVLGTEGFVFAAYLSWRYFENQSRVRLVAAGASIGVALLLKHTAIVLPAVMAGYAVLWWLVKPFAAKQVLAEWASLWWSRSFAMISLSLTILASMWALTRFDVSAPLPPILTRVLQTPPERLTDQEREWLGGMGPLIRKFPILSKPVPAGIYVWSLGCAVRHASGGHAGYLLGERRAHGWWYYFPVVATYKVPVGIIGVALLGVFSLWPLRPRWDEWGLVVPVTVFGAFVMNSGISIGFRHGLPGYVLLLMLVSRCAAAGRPWAIAGWAGVVVSAIHCCSFHPDYLSYINYPRHKPHLAITDSNIDWGQALKQLRKWVDTRPADGRQIYFAHFGDPCEQADLGATVSRPVGEAATPIDPMVRHYLVDRVIQLSRITKSKAPLPTSGILVVSPVAETGLYGFDEGFTALQPYDPETVIGHCLLVYDLDKLSGEGLFSWPAKRHAHTPFYEDARTPVHGCW